MSHFNLDGYETVKERKARFYQDHPEGRIIPFAVKVDDDMALFRVEVFVDSQPDSRPKAVGHALEIRDKEKKLTSYGKEYETVNFTSWVENCEESAVGRALDNAGYSGNKKCSKEEMEKAQRMSSAFSDAPVSPQPQSSSPKPQGNSYQGHNNNPGTIVLKFGPHKGKQIQELNPNLLADMANETKSAWLKGKILEYLNTTVPPEDDVPNFDENGAPF